jgi:tyrosine-protein kinase
MMEGQTDSRSLRAYWQALRLRLRLIIFIVIVTAASAVLFSLHQSPLYQASAQVYFKNQSLTVSQAGTVTPTANTQTADRTIQTQALLARTHEVAQAALNTLTPADSSLSAQKLLDDSSVAPDPNADILVFKVQNGDADRAVRLANVYAAAFVRARNSRDAAGFKAAYDQIQKELSGANAPKQQLALANLQEQAQQYALQEVLAKNNAEVVQTATDASKIRPAPVKAGIIGVILGLIIGIAAALLVNALDTRIRTAEDVQEAVGLPLLSRIPAPKKSQRKKQELATLSDAPGYHAESYRKLRTNLDFANLRPQAHVIVITSAIPREGKTTTTANLAVALARSGRRVALVDLDLRKPMIAAFFGLENRVGVTDVALGHAALPDALTRIAVTQRTPGADLGTPQNGNGSSEQLTGLLEVLPSGSIPPDPADFMSSPRLAEILSQLRERADIVLIDSAPLLAVSDTLALTSLVDGLVLVVKATVVKRPMLAEVRRLLNTVPCAKLGFILTNARAESQYGYGYGYGGYSGYAERSSAQMAPTQGEPTKGLP